VLMGNLWSGFRPGCVIPSRLLFGSRAGGRGTVSSSGENGLKTNFLLGGGLGRRKKGLCGRKCVRGKY
jgi:hypothetical protein